MKKPKKKNVKSKNTFDGDNIDMPIEVEAYNEGYNQAIDDYEAFLPTKDDLRLMISEFTGFDGVKDKLAKILSKRIRNDNE